MNLLIGKDTPGVAKDTVYRFMKMLQINWIRFTTILSSRIIKEAIIPLDSEDRVNVLLFTENKKNRVNEAKAVDKRTVCHKRRMLAMEKGTSAMLELLSSARKSGIPAEYVLFDSWFSSPSSLHAVKEIGYDVIAMVKKPPKMFFRYSGEDMPLASFSSKSRKDAADPDICFLL